METLTESNRLEPPAPPVPAPANKTELLVSLRHLLRGLSAVFWGLPLALLFCIPSQITLLMRPLNILPAVIVTGVLLLGVFEMARFRPYERDWQHSLDRARVFALLNVGLAPFIYFCDRMPNELYYRQMVWIMGAGAIFYVFNLNRSLKHLAAMLPDQTLREDTALFTSMNLGLIVTLVSLVGIYFGLGQVNELPIEVIQFLVMLEEHRRWLVIFLILLPVAMTMTLLWKIKEIVLTGIFSGHD
ncbi:MAG: hypothetical protein ACPGVU_10720 [Limisphaerales bacterium]